MTELDRRAARREAESAPAPARRPQMTFAEVMSAGGRMTLGVLFGLALLDSVDNAMFTVFAPEVRQSLGLNSATVAIVGALAGVMVYLGGIPLGVLGDRRRRTAIAGACTLVWAVAALLFGVVQALWQLVAVRILAGLGKANEGPIQTSILSDAYPPAGRGRVFGIHRGGLPLGTMVGPLLAAVFAATVPDRLEPWRWAFMLLAVPGIVLGLAALRLPEPVRGGFERQALLGGEPAPEPNPPPMSLWSAFARLRKIRTFSLAMVALGAFGISVTTVPIYLNLILDDHFGQDVTARGVIGAVMSVGSLAGAAFAGAYSDRLFRRRPVTCLYLASVALPALGVGFAVQVYSPNVTTFVAVGVLTHGMLFAGLVPLTLIIAAVTPPRLRATAFALVGLYLAFFGGLGGALVTGLAESFWGARAAVAVVAPSASIVAGLILASSSRHLNRDIARAAADVLKGAGVDQPPAEEQTAPRSGDPSGPPRRTRPRDGLLD